MAKTRHYQALDGLRGVAALAVVAFHAESYFGAFRPFGAYLAVDFFFVLSGFVIAHAYDDRLENSLNASKFMKVRLVRLFPLYLVSSAIAASATVVAVFVTHDASEWTSQSLLPSLLLAAVMLPSPATLNLFPLNDAAWSLFFELLVNGAYGTRIWQRGWFLYIVPAIASLGLLVEAIVCGSLDRGAQWGDPWWSTLAWGGFRVAYSFPIGLLLYRHRNLFQVPHFHVAILALILGMSLWIAPTGCWRPLFDVLFVVIISPTIVIIGSKSEPRSSYVSALCSFLGIISYPIYVLHRPITNIISGAARRLLHGPMNTAWQPEIGLLLLAILVVVATVANIADVRFRRYFMIRFSALRRIVPSESIVKAKD